MGPVDRPQLPARRRAVGLTVVVAVLAALALVVAGPAASAPVAVDGGFGTGGLAQIDVDGTTVERVVDLVRQADGGLVVAIDAAPDGAIARFLPNGQVDTGFGTDGVVVIDDVEVTGLALSGSDVVASVDTATGVGVAKVTAVGALDGTFGTGGVAEVVSTGTPHDVAVLSSGKVVLYLDEGGFTTLVGLTSAGALDGSFGTAGRATTTVRPVPSVPWPGRLLVQSDDKILATGYLAGTGGGLLRFTSSGALDTSFGSSGRAFQATETPTAIATSGSAIYTAGPVNDDTRPVVRKRSTSGALDTTYGSGGTATVPDTGAEVLALHVSTAGVATVVGSADSTALLVRLTAAGALDTGFGTTGMVTLGALEGVTPEELTGVAVDGSSRLLVAGTGDAGDKVGVVLRLDTTGGATSTTSTTVGPGQVAAGGTARSQTGRPTAAHPVVAEVTTPVAGTVTFAEEAGAVVPTYQAIGGIAVAAPSGTATNPLRIRLEVHAASVPASLPMGAVSLLRDSTEVAECESVAEAAPDPCILSRSRDGNVLTITVLSTSAGSWTVSRALVRRFSGRDRIRSAIAISRASFADGGASAAVIARSDLFADALAAAPLAVARGGPLLLSPPGGVDDAVMDEVRRTVPEGGTVFVLGGASAVSDAAVDRLLSWGYDVQRLAGRDRYETAVLVARRGLGSPAVVVETTGTSFPDALAAGTVASRVGGAVLLTQGAEQSPATAEYLRTVNPSRYAIGGPAAIADRGALPVAGIDRYETSVLAAKQFFPEMRVVGVASGETYADALPGSAQIARAGGPLLLVPSTGELPVSVGILLRAHTAPPPPTFLYGGTTAVAEDVATLLRGALTIAPRPEDDD